MKENSISDSFKYLAITYSKPKQTVKLEFNNGSRAASGYFKNLWSLYGSNGIEPLMFVTNQEPPKEIEIDCSTISSITLYESGKQIYFRNEKTEVNNLNFSAVPHMRFLFNFFGNGF